ncbi:MAG: TIGR03790 family protein, partial [Syntrophales bacterium]|nr:TIGR03790 family protein [Syntrophales bacterium]
QEKIDVIEGQITFFNKMNKAAALDSELALVLHDYPLLGWIPNPQFVGYRPKLSNKLKKDLFMVSRLDGPSVSIVRRIIDDSLLTEERGLGGTAYFDARWPHSTDEPLSAYAYYDWSIHRAAELVRAKGMKAILDEKEALFQPGECPEAALYCGWYSLGKYIDAFQWVRGAVGYHIASQECNTLKKSGSTVWCKAILEKGAAVTIGPVGEPYIQAFPPPDLFFKYILAGKMPLAECFARSNPYLSWKMVLIGDPLYRPFRHKAGK